MPCPSSAPDFDFAQETLQAYALNERMNQLLLEHLDSRAWRAKSSDHKGRTIADICAHVHSIRCKWLRLSAPHLKLPARLDRSRCTKKQARLALAESAGLCSQMLAEALSDPQGRVQSFVRDGWARPWPPGVAMFAYMITHDAHHRGQVCMLAHQLGFPLTGRGAYGIWVWEKLAKECGFQLLVPHKNKRRAGTGRSNPSSKLRSK
jgi:uncharacterized damage-inducible protein DinB